MIASILLCALLFGLVLGADPPEVQFRAYCVDAFGEDVLLVGAQT
ncbi:MAG: hypothetical protein WKH64_04910 [Chloroflexia bacterium]